MWDKRPGRPTVSVAPVLSSVPDDTSSVLPCPANNAACAVVKSPDKLTVESATDTVPGDIGWGHVLKRDHDFIGRRSLLMPECEREVMALVVSGLLNKQVGGELGISEITVKAHRGQVMRKIRAGSFADLVNMNAKLNVGTASKT